MSDSIGNLSDRARFLKGGASTFALGLAMIVSPAAAWAQDQASDQEAASVSADTDPEGAANSGEPEASDDSIIVTGTRRALNTSQNIKRNAETVVESITATDIGAFPDKSVAEALQRVPGITVNRFAATSDTAHFSAEPSGVIVRGLPQVRSEFNGRDTFSANSSRGLSWGDVTPELMAGVDTYKNQTAEMIEGGIAGSINLRTRVPFDADGQLIQFGVNGNYGDISGKITPDANAFYSNRWTTDIGEFGIMANVAYSKVETASQGIQYGRTGIFENTFGADGPDLAYIPSQVFFRDNLYERERKGIALAGQYRSPDRKILVTAQFNRSEYENKWEERSFQTYLFDLYGTDVRFRLRPGGDRANQIPVPAPGTSDFVFDDEGNFVSGTFNRPEIPWVGNPAGEAPWGGPYGPFTAGGYAVNDQGIPMFNPCYAWAGATAQARPGGPFCTDLGYTMGSDVGSASRFNENKNMTQDAAVNIKWEATDRLRFNFDGQYVDSTVRNYDIGNEYYSYADVTLDASGRYPRISLAPPTNVNQSQGGLANPNNWYLRSINDHLEDSEGTQFAARADAEYDIGTPWLDSLKVGARYADRDQVVRWSTYNWQNISNTWTDTNAPYWNIDRHSPSGNFQGYPEGLYEIAPFGTGFFGGNLGSFPFVPFEKLRNGGIREYSQENIGVGGWIPICDRNGQPVGDPPTPVELPDSCFTPQEVADVSETTKAVYAMLRFGGPDATFEGTRISGNIGLRYVETRNESRGFLRYATTNFDTSLCPPTPLVPGGFTGTGTEPTPIPGRPPSAPFPAACYLTGEDRAFASGGGAESVAKATHRHFLPSFNLRIDLNDKWLVRFAASRALSRPDIGLLKNFAEVSLSLPSGTSLGDERWVLGPDGRPIGVNPEYTANAYNPFLKPTTAWQFDISVENYFANVGSFSIAGFYKRFDDYIQYGSFEREVTRDGITRNVRVRGPANGSGAKIRGFEVAYQRFFDFLPDPLDGLGIQANYTFVENSGVPNSNLTPVGGTGGQTTNAGNNNTALTPGSLEGLSKHAYNIVGMYEKGPIAARLAYNWRSRYLVTAVDCCVYLPVWQEAAGFLDGSIRFKVTENIELSVQGSNLLNTKTVLKQQVTDTQSPEGEVRLAPNGWFQNDRRFTFGARFRF